MASLRPLRTVWTFEDPLDRLVPVAGEGQMDFWSSSGTSWSAGIEYGTAESFEIPSLDGCETRSILQLPSLTPYEGLLVAHHAPPNGYYADEGKVSEYTLLWDILVPQASEERFVALYQAEIGNTADAELFIDTEVPAGLGIATKYHGEIHSDTWYRIVVVVSVNPDGSFQLRKFIDGSLVGVQASVVDEMDAQRWALGSEFLLFADEGTMVEDGYRADETTLVFLANFAFVGAVLTDDQVMALGGPSAEAPFVFVP